MIGIPFGKAGRSAYGYAKRATIGFKHPFRAIRKQRKSFFPPNSKKHFQARKKSYGRRAFSSKYKAVSRNNRLRRYRRRY